MPLSNPLGSGYNLDNPITNRVNQAKNRTENRDLEAPWDVNTSEESIRSAKHWYMIVAEEGRVFKRGSRLSGQFTAQQVQHNIGAKITENAGFSRQSPIISWVGGNADSFTFQARLFSEHEDDLSPRKKYEIMKALMKRDEQLGRPPLVLFFWGNLIPDGFKCMIESIGNISYDELTNAGNFRGATLNISLKKWTEFKIEQVPISSTERTPVYIVKDGDTYEMIAYRMYGDPLLGVLLAQMNKRSPIEKYAPVGVTSLKPGEQIKIFPISDMLKQRIQPQTSLLQLNNRLSLMNRRYFFGLRSKEIGVILKK